MKLKQQESNLRAENARLRSGIEAIMRELSLDRNTVERLGALLNPRNGLEAMNRDMDKRDRARVRLNAEVRRAGEKR